MEHLQECRDASITGTKQGFAKGLCHSVPEVTKEVGAEEWMAMPRSSGAEWQQIRSGSRESSINHII